MSVIFGPQCAVNTAIDWLIGQLQDNTKKCGSICKIAQSFDVSHSTLADRISNRHGLLQRAQEHQQALSNAEEIVLVDYIWTMSLAGTPHQWIW